MAQPSISKHYSKACTLSSFRKKSYSLCNYLKSRFCFLNIKYPQYRSNSADVPFIHVYSSLQKYLFQTRMHSSRMRTARLLPYLPACTALGGCTYDGVYLPRRCTCEGVCTCQGVYLPGGIPARGMYLPGGVPASGVYLLGVYLSGGCTCQGGYLPRYSPPVNRMTDRCKNITLPQTSFADGNERA